MTRAVAEALKRSSALPEAASEPQPSRFRDVDAPAAERSARAPRVDLEPPASGGRARDGKRRVTGGSSRSRDADASEPLRLMQAHGPVEIDHISASERREANAAAVRIVVVPRPIQRLE